ncbi:hypothetical protein AAHH84_00325 [Candidatus Hodgkinia cicadicola]
MLLSLRLRLALFCKAFVQGLDTFPKFCWCALGFCNFSSVVNELCLDATSAKSFFCLIPKWLVAKQWIAFATTLVETFQLD